ncbi:MAG: antitoxin Xre/MbcA/ParS toxin-binding domain-containing protein, partial [Thiohalospira sp.]
LHKALHEGLSYSSFRVLAGVAGLDRTALSKAVAIPSATLSRRAKQGRFNAEESDRLFRFARVYDAAIQLFEGDAEAAIHWMRHPVRGLGGARPIDMLTTSAEAEAVLDLIGQLEHGVVA